MDFSAPVVEKFFVGFVVGLIGGKRSTQAAMVGSVHPTVVCDGAVAWATLSGIDSEEKW